MFDHVGSFSDEALRDCEIDLTPSKGMQLWVALLSGEKVTGIFMHRWTSLDNIFETAVVFEMCGVGAK